MNLSEDQRMIRETARQFARERLAPNAGEWDRAGGFPAEVLSEMGGLGLLGMSIAEQYGGVGADMTSYALALAEIAGGDGGVSTAMAVQTLTASVIGSFGTAAQKERWLPAMAGGATIGAFMLTEPSTGSDAGAIRARAVKTGNHYVLNGTKQFITNGARAGVGVVFAVTDPEAGPKGISAFVVPMDSPGLSVAHVEKKMGQRSGDTAQISFDDMTVTPDCLIGEEGQGYKIALSNLEGGRIGVSGQALGMAQAAFDVAVRYANERTSFGKKIIDHQAVGHRLADCATQLEAGWHLMLHAASLRDRGLPCLKEASMSKLFCSEMAERVCSAAVQTLGGYGYLEDFPVERYARDVRVTQIYEGTSDVQRMVIARTLTEN